MTSPGRPKDKMPDDLGARWENVLHGRASDKETEEVLRRIAQSGQKEMFDAQGEVYSAIKAHFGRSGVPIGFRKRLREMLSSETAKWLDWKKLRWAAVGAVAATVVLMAGFSYMRSRLEPERNLFALIAKEARAEYERAMLDPHPVQTGSTVLGRIVGWFEPRVHFTPLVYFGGGGETILEGGRVGYIDGVKVPSFLYRWKDKPVILVILPARKNPNWTKMPKRKWVALKSQGPTASVWRRGDFIYAIAGDVPIEKLREISRSVTPRDKKF